MAKDVWRRSNCDSIILLLQQTIRSTNPLVKFGISPFGVWRNKSSDPMGSETRAGQTNYDDLYADILLWLEKGWIDYVVPQLYWEKGHKLADYDVLLKWWNEHSYGKHLYIGHGFYRAGSNEAWKDKNQIPDQIKDLRLYNTTQGSVYYNSNSFNKNPNGWNDTLRNNYYRYPALIPPMSWINNVKPEQPTIEKTSTGVYKIIHKGSTQLKGFAVFQEIKSGNAELIYNQLIHLLVAENTTILDIQKLAIEKGKKIYIASVDKSNNISPLVLVQ